MYVGYSGTGTVGSPVIQEIEFSQGETITLALAVDTAGKTFVSDFRHEGHGSDFGNLLSEGSFTVETLGPSKIQLSSPSAGLAAGRYLYDVVSANSLGEISVSGLKEFKLLSSESVTGSGSVLPIVNGTQQLINASIAAYSASSPVYKKRFEILSPAQTVWTLAVLPASPELSELYLNGQKQRFLYDYTINAQAVIWLTLTLTDTDYLEISYYAFD